MAPEPVTEIPLFPLNVVLFPGARLPLRLFEDRYKELFTQSLKEGARFGIALIKEGVEAGGPATPFDVGTLAEIEAVDHHKEAIFLVVRGTKRFRIQSLERDRPYLVGKVQLLPDATARPTDAKAVGKLEEQFQDYVAHLGRFARSMGGELQVPEMAPDLGPLEKAYTIAFTLPLDPERKQALLESETLEDLAAKLRTLLEREAAFLRPDANDPSVA